MGGVLAYEVGAQLARDGDRSCVFMIDSTPGGPGGARYPDGDLGRHLMFLHDLARGRPDDELIAAVSGASPRDLPQVARDAAVLRGLLPDGFELAGYQRLVRVHADNLAALARYQPPRTDLPALLFTAAAGGQPGSAAVLWRAVCPGIEVEAWPRDHYSIVAADVVPAIAARAAGWAAAALRDLSPQSAGHPG
jgi:thioesterase domain-containing protein